MNLAVMTLTEPPNIEGLAVVVVVCLNTTAAVFADLARLGNKPTHLHGVLRLSASNLLGRRAHAHAAQFPAPTSSPVYRLRGVDPW